ncbi:hypothetical protein [Lysobacter panacisoli]|uniref:hypothetical protein n=1 Tax=Lysobacter panacisoli TaxID=1255263 RepID=UPI00131D95CA|nr:hypothetical protein [Lysobacter panacisoli]
MGKAILLLVVSLMGGVWFLHAGRLMTEKSIEEQYYVESSAMARFDADYLCDRLSDDFRHDSITFSLGGTQRETYDKQESCDVMREAFRDFKRLSALTNGRMGLSMENRIVEVSLSEDRKVAHVEAIGVVRLGGRMLSRSHYVDRLVRRNGRILHEASESKSWLYIPAGK